MGYAHPWPILGRTDKGAGSVAINVCTALLLEDEPLVAIDLEMTLTAAGFTVYTAMSCIEANLWLESNRPDIVVVDIELRDGTCAGVVTRLNEANIPFVVYTGDPPSFHIGTPFAHGCAWLGKPATAERILQAVRSGLQRGQAISDQVRILIQPG